MEKENSLQAIAEQTFAEKTGVAIGAMSISEDPIFTECQKILKTGNATFARICKVTGKAVLCLADRGSWQGFLALHKSGLMSDPHVGVDARRAFRAVQILTSSDFNLETREYDSRKFVLSYNAANGVVTNPLSFPDHKVIRERWNALPDNWKGFEISNILTNFKPVKKSSENPCELIFRQLQEYALAFEKAKAGKEKMKSSETRKAEAFVAFVQAHGRKPAEAVAAIGNLLAAVSPSTK